MKKLETLTPEQEQKMLEVRDFWKDYIFSCKNRTNRPAAVAAISWLYKFSKQDGLRRIIFVDSPMAVQYAVSYLKEIAKLPQGGRSEPKANVWANVGANVRANVWANVRDNVGANVGDNYERFAYYGNVSDYGWMAYYDYFLQIGAIQQNDDFIRFRDMLLTGIYDMVQLASVCIVSDMPTKIIRNASGRLHNPTGPAIEFADGYCQYYINGRALPSWIWEKAASGEITREMFLQEQNSEIKGGIYEVLGQKRMMDLLGAEEVDTRIITHTNGEMETVTLLKTKDRFEEIDNQPFAWVKMVCPSTGSQYLQGVEPHHTNAVEAMASLSMFTVNEYSFDFRS